MKAAIVGGGIFGLTAAVELRRRGCEVTLFDPGPPHPLAESTDISKVVRLDYGADADYVALGEAALDGWRRWNVDGDVELFHETGVTFLAKTLMQPGGFEHDSFTTLIQRGHRLERLDARAIAARFPAYRPGVYVDGYFNPEGGWVAATTLVVTLLAAARDAGVTVIDRAVDEITEDGVIAGGARTTAELVIVCAGAWVPNLIPALADSLRAVGQPVFHLRPADPSVFAPEHFPVFGADIARTGYYGFPVNRDGIVKIANHGTGVRVARDADRVVSTEQTAALRAFVRESLPDLDGAPITHTRLCVYCDTLDEHFWIARDPDRPNLVVATGGSGHAFKFAPVLGPLIADIALGALDARHALARKFRWRPELATKARGDAARSG